MPQLRDSSNSAPLDRNATDTSFERIFGIETEYGVSLTGVAARLHRDAATVAALMFEPVVHADQSTNTYADNGSRVYLDVGAHPEYATAEARTVTDAVKLEAAGDLFMHNLARDAQKRLQSQLGENGKNARIHVYKNNMDSRGSSFGCHENYLLRRSVSLPLLERAFIPFLVTRQIFAGSGMWTGSHFEISQRARFLDDTISSATTRSRPMINTRDESHADSRQYRRLHVIVGDSNISQRATWMKLMSAHLILCAIEDESRHCHSYGAWPQIENAGAEIKAVSCDMNFEHRLKLSDGRELNALESQRFYLNVAQRFLERHRGDLAQDVYSEAMQCVQMWNAALEAFETNQYASLASWVDWVAKYQLLEGLEKREASHSRMQQVDFAYHDIAHAEVSDALKKRGMISAIFSDESVTQALTRPPLGTRAQLRSLFVSTARRYKKKWSADWTSVTLLDSHSSVHSTVQLLDPFDARPTTQFNELIDTMTQSELPPTAMFI